MDMPLNELARDYESLASRARAGDAEAAYKLYAATASCKDVAASEADLAGQKKEIQRNAENDKDREAQQHFAQEQFDRCSPLSMGQRREWLEWLAVAARLGNADAQLRYVRAATPTKGDSEKYWSDLESYRNTAAQYLDDQIARGNVDALLTAASVYDANSNADLFKANSVTHYAYLYAYAMATGEQAGVFFDKLARGQDVLSEQEKTKVQALGEEIYSKCCKH